MLEHAITGDWCLWSQPEGKWLNVGHDAARIHYTFLVGEATPDLHVRPVINGMRHTAPSLIGTLSPQKAALLAR